jgi:hypothetical protein
MKGKPTLYIDQWGSRWWAKTVKELREQIGGRVSKMYVDKKDGRSVHIGYVVGQHWLTAYQRVEGTNV